MVPVSVNRKNVLQWIVFGILESWRVLLAILFRSPNRELEVTRLVERTAVQGDPKSVLAVMDQFAQEKRFLMNVGIEKGRVLREAVRMSGAQRALELGAYCGYSAVLLASELRKMGGSLISVEANPTNAALARRVVRHAGLADIVEIRVATAADEIPQLDCKFELVFIDHWKDAYLSDLRRLEDANLLKDGAIVVADNVGIFSDTLCEYLDYVRNNPHYSSTHYPLPMEYNASIEDGVEVSIRRSAAQSISA